MVAYFLKPLSIFLVVCFPTPIKINLRHLQSALQTAFENEQAYLANPTDFLTAYHFIDTHPAFWTVIGDVPIMALEYMGALPKCLSRCMIMMKIMGN